jgi:hypothetical protein
MSLATNKSNSYTETGRPMFSLWPRLQNYFEPNNLEWSWSVLVVLRTLLHSTAITSNSSGTFSPYFVYCVRNNLRVWNTIWLHIFITPSSTSSTYRHCLHFTETLSHSLYFLYSFQVSQFYSRYTGTWTQAVCTNLLVNKNKECQYKLYWKMKGILLWNGVA